MAIGGRSSATELPLLRKDQSAAYHTPHAHNAHNDNDTSASMMSAVRESIRDDRSRVRMFGWLLIWVVVGIFISEVSQRSVVTMMATPQQASLIHDAVRQEVDFLAAVCPTKTEDATVAAASSPKAKDSHWFLKGSDPELLLTSLPKISSLDELPAHWDWRDFNGTGIGLTTSVLNQMAPKACGSCWAFATVSALSDRIRIAKYRKYKKLGPEVILSPQVLLDCGMRSFGSCNGGDPRYAHKWIHENGIVDLTCNPYIASHPSWFTSSGSCAATQCRQCLLSGECRVVEDPKKYYISEYGTLNATNSEEFQLEAMNEIYHRGPIVVSMYSLTPEYRNHKGGSILRDSTKYPGTTHVVSLVGWGTDDSGVKYWIVRNSDGTGFGDEGFFLAERGVNIYNIETHGAWAVPIV
ncbi:Cathepsin, cysteine protease family c01a, partial [Globisporangium splendens]